MKYLLLISLIALGLSGCVSKEIVFRGGRIFDCISDTVTYQDNRKFMRLITYYDNDSISVMDAPICKEGLGFSATLVPVQVDAKTRETYLNLGPE